MIKENSYKKNLAPLPGRDSNEKLDINMSLNVISLGSFKAITQSFEAKLTMKMSWKDNRLHFINLRNTSEENTLSSKEKDYIWLPRFVFENTKEKSTSVVDDKTVVWVERNGIEEISDITSMENKLLYKGSENPIIYKRFYNIVFECEYLLHWYPFDYQLCLIEISPTSDQIKFTRFVEGRFDYSGSKTLMKYKVRSIEIIRNKTGLKVKVKIGRTLLSIVLTIFIPTLLINIIGHTSNFFKHFYFEAKISLNVTVMLVLTTMFVGISGKLPETAYVKSIDLWMIFSLLKPFVDIMIQTYVESLRSEDEGVDMNNSVMIVSQGGGMDCKEQQFR